MRNLTQRSKFYLVLVVMVLFAISALLWVPGADRLVLHTHAQQSPSTIVGQIIPSNYLAPTSAAGQLAVMGGVASNPSGLVLQITGGNIFASGQSLSLPPVQITLLASTTYGVYFNTGNGQVYARTAVIGPGSPAGQPGVPNTILSPTPSEIPICTVVAGASSLTITDARVPSQWNVGDVTGAHLITSSTNGDITGVAALSGGTKAITFGIPYQTAPNCLAQDATTIANTVTAVTSGGPPVTTLTLTGTGTDSIKYICVGNPN